MQIHTNFYHRNNFCFNFHTQSSLHMTTAFPYTSMAQSTCVLFFCPFCGAQFTFFPCCSTSLGCYACLFTWCVINVLPNFLHSFLSRNILFFLCCKLSCKFQSQFSKKISPWYLAFLFFFCKLANYAIYVQDEANTTISQ